MESIIQGEEECDEECQSRIKKGYSEQLETEAKYKQIYEVSNSEPEDEDKIQVIVVVVICLGACTIIVSVIIILVKKKNSRKILE